jgi:hypothetical protein
MLNNIKFGSRLIQSNLNRKRFSTTTKNLSSSIPKSNKSKLFLAITTLPAASFYLYYQVILNDQEKRKVRVNISSIFRAVRSFKVGLYIASDYKWSLMGLNEVKKKNSFYSLKILIIKNIF